MIFPRRKRKRGRREKMAALWSAAIGKSLSLLGCLKAYAALRLGWVDLCFEVGVEEFAAEVGTTHLAPDVDNRGGDEDR